MSRDIKSNKIPQSEELKSALDAKNQKLIFTLFQNRKCMLYIDNSVLKLMQFVDEEFSDLQGIYIGRIQKDMPATNCCFVEYKKKTVGYLNYKDASDPVLFNRTYDGKLKQGDLLLVKVARAGVKTKLPSLQANLAGEFSDEELILISHKAAFSVVREPVCAWKTMLESYLSAAEYNEVITDIPEAYEEIKEYFETLGKTVRLYKDQALPLSSLYSLNTKCQAALDSKVWLKSGAYLVIEQTESFNVIDINSGKNNKRNNSADYILAINKEAAQEIAVQIRLRNLSGIILVDFINMKDKEDQKLLLQYMQELCKEDVIPTYVHDITRLGIMEITRSKTGKSLKETYKQD